jgi:hypothetical protein
MGKTIMRYTNMRIMKPVVWFAAVLLLQIALPAGALDYAIDWQTIDAGGGRSTGGPYVLTGTIGQPDADWAEGGAYEVLGGFWPGGPLCFVEFGDFALFADMWLTADLTADLDNDNDIDFGDLKYLTEFWLSGCPYAWPLR